MPRPRARSARAVALEVLERFDSDPNAHAIERFDALATESALDARERRFGAELVLGVIRRRITLDCAIAAYCRAPLATLDPKALHALRLGVYQLLYLEGIPPFAAVAETVDLVRRSHEGVRSTVNAILRTIDREARRIDPTLDRGGSSSTKRLEVSDHRVVYFSKDVFCRPDENPALHLAQIHGHPAFLVMRWLERFGAEGAAEILRANNARPRATARIDLSRATRDAILYRLNSEGLSCGAGKREDSIEFGSPIGEVLNSRTFRDGMFYLQDETAMQVAPALAPQLGERILDLCAAPGGKATHLAELASDRAEILAVDRAESRLSLVRENAERLKRTSIRTLLCDVLAPERALPSELDGPFDAILLDVPCSNTGVLARRIEARHRVHPQAILDLAEQGRRLFAFAATRIKPGGRIVYSTCSIEHEENKENVTRCLVATPAARVESEQLSLPGTSRCDGGYYAVIRFATQ